MTDMVLEWLKKTHEKYMSINSLDSIDRYELSESMKKIFMLEELIKRREKELEYDKTLLRQL